VSVSRAPGQLGSIGGMVGLTPAAVALFELPAPSLRVFQRVVQCLAKLGRDAALILRSEELVLHGADDSHSAAMQFAFRRKFFRTAPTSSAILEQHREIAIVVGSKALLVALKGSQQRGGYAESLTLCLSGAGAGGGDHQRLVLEFTARFGGKVRHRVPLLDSKPFLPGEPQAGPHVSAMSPSLLARVLDHCSPTSNRNGCEEVTMTAVPQEGLRVQSYDLLGGGGGGGGGMQANRTEVLIQRSDLEACCFSSHGEVTFSGRGLREFARAADACARDLEVLGLVQGSPLLELRFGADSASVVCVLAAIADGVVRSLLDFSAVFIIATRDLPSDMGSVPPTAAAPTQVAHANIQPHRRPQPAQGTKRRAVTTPASGQAFDAFPDHSSQTPRTQPATSASSDRPPQQLAPPPGTSAAPAHQLHQPAQQHLQHAQPPLHTQAAPTPATQHATQPFVGQASRPGLAAAAPFPPAWPAAPAAAPPAACQTSVACNSVPSSSPPPTMPAAPAPGTGGGLWWQGGQAPPPQVLAGRPAGGPPPVVASQLAPALDVCDSDDEPIGADPDEVAFARGDPGEDSVDWFDTERLW